MNENSLPLNPDAHAFLLSLPAPDSDGDEPWRDKPEMANRLSCSVRWVEGRMGEGAPHTHIAGKAKFKASVFERWLREHGHIERKGQQ